MKNLILLISFTMTFSALLAQSKDEKEIISSMQLQENAWNNGNLELFMSTYYNNDSLMFIGKKGVTRGWQNTLNNYKKGYPDTAAMGKLHFELLETKKLSSNYFYVVGKWHLTRTAGDLEGHFTLLFQKINNKWVITRDHSS